MNKLPLSIFAEAGLDIVGRIGDAVARAPVADFEVDDRLGRAVDEVMPGAGTSLESGAHAGRQGGLAGVCHHQRLARQDINELVLLRVGMAQSRDRPWNAACFYDQSLADAYDALLENPALAALGTLAAVEPGGQRIRDAFTKATRRQNPDMRALWAS